MDSLIKLYLQALVVTGFLDFIWLGIISKKFYQAQIGFLFKNAFSWPAILAFYFMYAAALAIFVLEPALKQQSLLRAVFLGALLGLTAYGTYNLTNYATLKGWPLTVLFIDTGWGIFMTALAALIIYKFFH